MASKMAAANAAAGYPPQGGAPQGGQGGYVSWEEINDGTMGGKNFGWPIAEGVSRNPDFANPIYTYGHGDGDGVGCAITGGTFFSPAQTNYPSQYRGGYFFMDFCSLINLFYINDDCCIDSFIVLDHPWIIIVLVYDDKF